MGTFLARAGKELNRLKILLWFRRLMTAIAITNSIQTVQSKNWPVFKTLTVGPVSNAIR